MKEKLKSRKFWMAVASAALIVANDGLDLGLNEETVWGVVGLAASFIFAQAKVDTAEKGAQQ